MVASFCVVGVSVSSLLGLYPIVFHQLWLKNILSSDIVQCPPGEEIIPEPQQSAGPTATPPLLGLDVPSWHELVVKSMVSSQKRKKVPTTHGEDKPQKHGYKEKPDVRGHVLSRAGDVTQTAASSPSMCKVLGSILSTT